MARHLARTNFVSNNNIDKVKLERGTVFPDTNAFRRALTEYVMRQGFEIVKTKNEKAKVIKS